MGSAGTGQVPLHFGPFGQCVTASAVTGPWC